MKKFILRAALAGAMLAGLSSLAMADPAPLEKWDSPYGSQEILISSRSVIIQSGTSGHPNVLGETTFTGQLKLSDGLAIVHESFIDPIAVDSNTFLSAVNITSTTLGAQTTMYVVRDFLVQPPEPRNIAFIVSGPASTGTVAINGVTGNGDTVTDTLAFNVNTTSKSVVSNYAFLQLSSVTLTYTAYGDVGTKTFWVGVSSGIGLSNDITSSADVLRATESAAAAAGTIDATYDTYLPATAPNGTADIQIWYRERTSP